MRIATYNVEWFTNLFDHNDHVLADGERSGREGVTRGDQVAAIGRVLRAVDADLVLIVEAPDSGHGRQTVRALENFAKAASLRTTQSVMGFANGTEQELAVLYDPQLVSVNHTPRGSPVGNHLDRLAPRFDTVFRYDLDADGIAEPVTFSKPPLELTVKTKAGHELSLIGVHIKSKAPHGARNENDVMRISIENRKKALAQCIWLRRRIDEHLAAHRSLVVLGDVNDGPGLDEYEKLFGRSSVEVLIGDGAGEHLVEPHADTILQRKGVAAPTSSRFYLVQEGRYLEALLDYIMLSKDLAAKGAKWRILHPFDDPASFADDTLRQALLTASDHFPVFVDLDL
ncbi:MAG: endonuclease/exonuclease/phosphatase family protein [Deltaproteobacteria bacterium]